MLERWRPTQADVDRQYLLKRVVLPAAATFLVMAVCWALVSGILLLAEPLITGSLVTQALALLLMFVVPQFAVGALVGYRSGPDISPPIAAGLTPLVVLMLGLAVFGGPPLSPLQSPGYVLVAFLVWTVTFATGMVVGEKIRAPRSARETQNKDAA